MECIGRKPASGSTTRGESDATRKKRDVVLLPLALTQRRLARWEGGLLLLGYLGYILSLALR